jgi:hypothetical protein
MLNWFQHPIIKVYDRPICYMQIADQARVDLSCGFPKQVRDDVVARSVPSVKECNKIKNGTEQNKRSLHRVIANDSEAIPNYTGRRDGCTTCIASLPIGDY